MESKKRILIVVPNDLLGGAEGVLRMIALYFSDHAIDVRFLTKRRAGSWKIASKNFNFTHTRAAREYIGALRFFCSFFFSRRIKYDYIFTSHVFVTGLVGLMIRLGVVRKRFFVARESTLIFKRFTKFKLFLYKLMYRFGYPSVDLLICQSNHMKDELTKALPGLTRITNLIFIANPIDLNDLSGKEDFCMSEDHGRFVVSGGRLIPEKGFDLLILAFKRLKNDYPDLKLIILGEGKEREQLQRLIETALLQEDVVLNGFVPNVYPYFKSATVCVVSSRIEGFPNVLLQMMSQNTKVVSTKCAGGIEDINGIQIAETNDIDSLYFAMKHVLDSDSTANRAKFDVELRKRSINSFMKKIFENLSD